MTQRQVFTHRLWNSCVELKKRDSEKIHISNWNQAFKKKIEPQDLPNQQNHGSSPAKGARQLRGGFLRCKVATTNVGGRGELRQVLLFFSRRWLVVVVVVVGVGVLTYWLFMNIWFFVRILIQYFFILVPFLVGSLYLESKKPRIFKFCVMKLWWSNQSCIEFG